MLARTIASARLKAVRGARMADAKGLERRRGLISFLTWAFFLAEVFGHDAPSAFAAHASNDEDASPRHSADDAAPAAEHADQPMLPPADEPEITPDQFVSSTPGILPTVGQSGFSEFGASFPADATGVPPPPAFGGHGDAHRGTHEPSASDSTATDVAADHGGTAFGGSLTMDVSFAPHGLLHALSDPLGLVSTVTDAVEDVAGTVLHTVSALTGGLGSLLSIDGGPDGLLSFGPAAPSEAYEIETAKGFTDFGISLGLGQSAASSSLVLTSAPLEISSLGHEVATDHLQISSISGSSDEFGHRSAVDVLA